MPISSRAGFRLLPVCALVLGASPAAHALQFNLGDIEGNFTSSFSLGASWRTEDPSNRVVSPGNTNGEGRAASSVTDDGNLNYEEGDMYSLMFRGIHDLDLNTDLGGINLGVFTRFKYWYDHELAEGNVPHGHAATNYVPDQELDTSGFEPLAQEDGFRFLDYYIYSSFDVADRPVELRVGNMVLSWGESTFIQNGVNIISPFDVTALRSPGSELKEALLPVGLVYANVGVTYDLSVEAFYQYDWERTVLDECGTYWNSSDPYGGGCNYLTATGLQSDFDQVNDVPPFILPRTPDDTPSDSGQWGIAARYFVEALNSTEFGVYYINYHERTPIFSGVNPTENFGQPFILGSNPEYILEFIEDTEVYGLSFATNLGSWAWSGELSYRPNFPLAINQTQVLQAAALGSFAEWSTVQERASAAGPGGIVHGYDEVKYTQFQMTFIKFFEQVLGADRLSFGAEAAAVFLDDMDSDQVYGRSSSYGVGSFAPIESEVFPGVTITCDSHAALEAIANFTPNSNSRYCNNEGFTTDFSWGYRVRASLEYSDVFAGINLTPSLAWSHDVKGYSPPPNFIEGRMGLSGGLQADYLNTYRANLSYTTFFGADYNDQQDRDFVSLSFSVAF